MKKRNAITNGNTVYHIITLLDATGDTGGETGGALNPTNVNFNHDDSQSANNPYDKFSPKVNYSNYNPYIELSAQFLRI